MSSRPVRQEEDSDEPFDRWRGRLRPPLGNEGTRRVPAERAIERPRTVQEAADELGLSVHTIRAWIASRRLGHLRLGRAIRIPASELQRIMEESMVPALTDKR